MIIRNALAQEFKDIASLTVEAYREYALALTPNNWQMLQTSLANVVQVAKQGQIIIAEQNQQLAGSVVY